MHLFLKYIKAHFLKKPPLYKNRLSKVIMKNINIEVLQLYGF